MKPHPVSELPAAPIAASVSTVLSGGAWLGLLVAAFFAGAQPGYAQVPDAETQRRDIDVERSRIETRHAQQRWICSHRFFVTACMEQARVEQREAIALLDHREAELDSLERRERADRRLALIREKSDALARVRALSLDGSAAPPVVVPGAAPAAAPAAAPSAASVAAPGVAPAAVPESDSARAPAKRPAALARADERAAADRQAQQRAEAASQNRAAAAKRQAAGAKPGSDRGKAAAPLPERPVIPPAVPASN